MCIEPYFITVRHFGLMAKTKKIKSPTKTKLRQKADSVFSTFVRLRDSNKQWIVVCPLCWSKLPRKKAQNMHFIKRSCWFYRYDESNCHAWCYRCNVILSWNYIAYTRWMQKQYGIEYVDSMIDESKKIHKEWSKEDYQKIIDAYTEKIIEYSRKLTA